MDNAVVKEQLERDERIVAMVKRCFKEHEASILRLNNKIKWLEKRLDNQRVDCGDGRLRKVV